MSEAVKRELNDQEARDEVMSLFKACYNKEKTPEEAMKDLEFLID